MNVRCVSKIRDEETGHVTLKFQHTTRFSKEQIFHLRAGTVMECLPISSSPPPQMDSAVLGCVRSSSREDLEKNYTFSVMVFREPTTTTKSADSTDDEDTSSVEENEEWLVTPIAGLISEFRQFDACTSKNVANIPFLTALLGHFPKHTRFTYSSDEEEEEEKPDKEEDENDVDDAQSIASRSDCDDEWSATDDVSTTSSGDSSSSDDAFDLPLLNPTQEKAAVQFLNASPSSITLVQGPPGTGKSSLIVSIICRYLSMPKGSRMMVCAPTNKAVSVLAARLVDALGDKTAEHNVVLVGDSDKLLENDADDVCGSSSTLQSIFIYTWIEKVIEEYRTLQQMIADFSSGGRGDSDVRQNLYNKAAQLREKLIRSLPVSSKGSISKQADEIRIRLKPKSEIAASTASEIGALIAELSDLAPDDVCRELLRSAQIIFCTLTTSGGSIFKRTSRICDLVVDEAAASTEAELCIPFHLRPRRLLCVGDPMQLPATVLSRKAALLGLEKSLHSRLMHECSCPHLMLDIQYRMNPAISLFPADKFYDGNLMNGSNVLRLVPRLLLHGNVLTCKIPEFRSNISPFFRTVHFTTTAHLCWMVKHTHLCK